MRQEMTLKQSMTLQLINNNSHHNVGHRNVGHQMQSRVQCHIHVLLHNMSIDFHIIMNKPQQHNRDSARTTEIQHVQQVFTRVVYVLYTYVK